jgi:hypothetical protein
MRESTVSQIVQVHAVEAGTSACLMDGINDLLPPRLAPAAYDHMGAFLGKCFGDTDADAARRTRHNRDLAFEPLHADLPYSILFVISI